MQPRRPGSSAARVPLPLSICPSPCKTDVVLCYLLEFDSSRWLCQHVWFEKYSQPTFLFTWCTRVYYSLTWWLLTWWKLQPWPWLSPPSPLCGSLYSKKRQAQGGPEAAVADLVTCFGKVLLHNLNCHNLLLGCGSGSVARQLFVITGRGGGSRLLVRGSPGVRAMGQSLGLGATLPPCSCPSSLLSACHLILQGGFCCWLWGMWEYL